ncbi:DUF1877 domain-containing protein [Streptomyces albogriseolus]
MAVTLQLARATPDYLASCRRAAEASPNGDPEWDPPSADVLDLDWAPAPLMRVCELGGADDVHRQALWHALEGGPDVDLVFLNTPPHEIALLGPDPAALSPDHVARIADLLAEIDFPGLLASLPADESSASALIGYGTDGIVGGVRKYLLTHFNAVRRFYRDAALRHLLVVLWWD